mgnify:CR=1 FL=1
MYQLLFVFCLSFHFRMFCSACGFGDFVRKLSDFVFCIPQKGDNIIDMKG